MESVAIRPPSSTVTRATSAGPSPPRRNPMEDADSSVTRKRPRLDSGDRAHRSMSADRVRAAPSALEHTRASTPPHSGNHSKSTNEHNNSSPIDRMPSKVTINVRDPIQNASSSQMGVNGIDEPAPADKDKMPPSSQVDSPSRIEPRSPDVVSVDFSPTRSPEIEVADIEDMNDEPGETKWRPLASLIIQAKDTQGALLEAFPYAVPNRDLRQTVQLVSQEIEKNPVDESQLLKTLADWIEMYIQTTDPHDTQWWDMYLDEREFWDEFPSIIEGLLRRSTSRLGATLIAPETTDEESVSSQHFEQFLVAFTALAYRMLQIDCQTLNECGVTMNITLDLVSPRYLSNLTALTAPGCNFWKCLYDTCRYDSKSTITAIVVRFTSGSSSGVRRLSQFIKGLLDRSQTTPSLAQKLWLPLRIVNQIMTHHNILMESNDEHDQNMLKSLRRLPSEAYELFQVIDSTLQVFISKQVSVLSLETSQSLVQYLSPLLYSIATADEELTAFTLRTRLGLSQEFEHNDGATMVELAWKFELLKKCILEGRMEIRVQGVETMQIELVNIYTKYIVRTKAHKDHPVAQSLSDFMLANKLVEYFVGVDSHPQLISRCGNIIGFLVITGRYTDAESDAIWKAVTTSQDSRIVDAVLMMLIGFFNLSPYSILLYLTKKLNELPLEAFDSSMIHYSTQLLEHLRIKWRELRLDTKMDMPPYHLCIRLIRQAAAEKGLAYPRTREILNFAVCELRGFLTLGPSDVDRSTIYEECLKDISCRTRFATGSVSAINALLTQNPEGDIKMLANDWGLTNLIIEEFAHATDAETSTQSTPRTSDEGLTVRLELLQSIIFYIADTITPEAGQRLWDAMLGRETLSERARDAAWNILGKATRISLHRNSFIDRCIRDYLPKLNPRFITKGCLSFVNQVVQYESRSSMRHDRQQSIGALGGELLWHLSLVAPVGTIENQAVCMLVGLYLDFYKNQHMAQPALDSMQIQVVERCIRDLKFAASRLKAFSDGTSSGEDEPMVVVATEEEMKMQRTSFSRSLLILKEFVQGVRSRPRYYPFPQKSPQPPLASQHDHKGDRIQIRYQSFSGGRNTLIQSVETGDLETVEDLTNRLIELTGFSNFTAIAGGQKLDLATDSHLTLREMRLEQKGLLIVKKAHDTNEVPDLVPAVGFRPLELEVMKNFQELYQLLGMEEGLARDVYEILVAFPPHESVTAKICSGDTPLETIFPPTIPFKILYSVYALKACLRYQLQNVCFFRNLKTLSDTKFSQGTATQEFMCRGVRLLASALIIPNIINSSLDTKVDLATTAGLVDCLLFFLKEPVSDEIASKFFTAAEAQAFLERLQSLILHATIISASHAHRLVCDCFATILEASLHCKNVWSFFKSTDKCTSLFRCLLLEEEREEIRQGAAESIRGICCTLLPTPSPLGQDIVSYFWSTLVILIPRSLQHGKTCQQFFEIALIVFRTIDDGVREKLDFATYIQVWSDLLLKHKHVEFVGRDNIDWIIHGIACLLNWCIQLAKSMKKPLTVKDSLTETLFCAHLFPEISKSNENALIEARVPTLHSATRQELYSVITALSYNMTGYETLLRLVRDLLPQGEDPNAWSWGIAQISEDYSYEANWNFERSKSIRSLTGYPGLRNLSNTCYLNSLFTQLYMNLSFRSFMLNTNIADGSSSQKLLFETKRLFGYMQDTMLRSVDPQGIADSIVTYENTLIDVSVQMDVDEFYNLLFDRWESQILSDAGKKTFRRFYGGQIVQQIKSKECPHISEKIEPFSAIQCDIQGKATLTESLNAYVGGEVMEGDNKYSCTSCGCYVDAVKRACLKDIPNNLIFHLKRFDYDVMTGMRSKINDRFEFPETIDMSPYHIDYLKDSRQPAPPDMFELVGILVHSGTAESGHYYSYIRERPAPRSQPATWVEFNDADVTRFDQANIPDQCFGGPAEASPFSSVRFPKTWNAYMLFYQRMDDMEAECKEHVMSTVGFPARAELPLELSNRIAIENELFIRRYCLFDPAHAFFARTLLEQLRNLSKGTCSDDHAIEREAIWLALEHLDLILSRPKDSTGFDRMLTSLTRVIGTCSHCCKLALDWVVEQKFALRNLLMRSPILKVRKDFSGMIMTALQYLRKHDPRLYGFDVDEIEDEPVVTHLPENYGAVHGIVSGLKELWPVIYQHSRAWDDYFGLLVEITNFGISEAHIILREGFLLRCLEVLILEHPGGKRLRSDAPHYASYFRLVEKGRKFSFVKFIELIRALLDRIDLEPRPLPYSPKERALSDGKMMLTEVEEEYLRYTGGDSGRSKSLVVLEKILGVDHNSTAARGIVRTMVLAEPTLGLLTETLRTITSGISIDPASLAAPYLAAALTFCESCPTVSAAKEMIHYIAREVDTIGMSGGKEHLEFFVQARRLHNVRFNRNQAAIFFGRIVLHTVPQWAPPLIMYWEESVRGGTIDLLKALVFNRDIRNMDNEQEAEDIERIARELCRACVKRIQTQIVEQQKPVETRSVESITMVIRHCLGHYYQVEDVPDDRDAVVEAETVLEALQTLTVIDAEDAISEWGNGDSDMNTEDSESENMMET